MAETEIEDFVPEALRKLAADGPAPEHAEKLMLYGQFVGSWDVHAREFKPDGRRTERQGE